jgi:5-formyltetrahydrofolate cyclo-ligase
LREEVLGRRGALDAPSRVRLSRSIVAGIVGLEAYRRSEVVLAYAGFGSEMRTDGFLRHVLDGGKTLVLPRVNREKGTLDLYEVGDPRRDLRPGAWGIREPLPEPGRRVSPDDLAFVLVPGVAFDPTGGRLGYGGGYYDKLLAGRDPARTVLVAGAFEVQMVEEVPLEAHDARVDAIFTERRCCPATGTRARSRVTTKGKGNPALSG